MRVYVDDGDNPGTFLPMDYCLKCWGNLELSAGVPDDHPPYDDLYGVT